MERNYHFYYQENLKRPKYVAKLYLSLGRGEREKILKEYYDTIFFRDFVERHELKSLEIARFIFSFVFQNFASEISVNKIVNFLKSEGKKFGKNTVYSYIEKLQVTYAADRTEIEKREVDALLKVSGEFKCKNMCMITWDYEAELNVEDKTIKCIPLWKWLTKLENSDFSI